MGFCEENGMEIERIEGLISAPFTPLDSSNSVDFNTIDKYGKFLKRNGVKGVFICGTSGEGVSLSDDDRKKLTIEWKKHCSTDFKLIVHVGHTSLKTTINLAEHAESVGVTGISSMAPIFFKPTNLKDLVLYCKQIAASAPNTPFYYYHIPGMTGVNFSMYDFLELASKEIPTLAGIKFTNEDIRDLSLALNFEDGKYDILWGVDDTMTSALSVGCRGFIGSTFNYAPNKYQQVLDNYTSGNISKAASAQLEMNKIVKVLIDSPLPPIATQRILIEQAGMDCGTGDTAKLYPDYNELSRQVIDHLKSTTFYDITGNLC